MNTKKNFDMCECGHDRSCHPRQPCISGWDGIENRGACRCEEFKVRKSQMEVVF